MTAHRRAKRLTRNGRAPRMRSWSAPDMGEAAQSRIRLRDGQDDLATPAKTDYAPPLAFAPAGG
ncbi:hypothetical protein MRA01_45420 [Methylobacterium radiotolerans]|nr:hypothetical protein MRA01_45420 [Methylobacterium radiotolerans]